MNKEIGRLIQRKLSASGVKHAELLQTLAIKLRLNIKNKTWNDAQNLGGKGMLKGLAERFVLCVLVAVAAVTAPPVLAQEYGYGELPVLDPKPDFNGVDSTSGSFSTASPLTFNVPGAGHLNVQHMFNGRQETFSLNIHLDDTTFIPSGAMELDGTRHIKVHLGGVDKLFTCVEIGECTQDVHKDGSRLTRLTELNYVFTDKYGAVYTFLPTYKQPLLPCTFTGGDPEDDQCNAAQYHAYTYVSTIVYPNGEKLTYEPFGYLTEENGQKYNASTIQSNLGYKLIIESSVDDSFTLQTQPGFNWLSNVSLNSYAGSSKTKMSLYRGAVRINTLTTSRTLVSTNPKFIKVNHSDDLGRIFEFDLQGGVVLRCSLDSWQPSPVFDGVIPMLQYDATVMVPVRQKTPGGVATVINYHMVNASNWTFSEAAGRGTSIPVKTVKRGGKTWTYDNVENQKTLTAPNQKTRSIEFDWIQDGYNYGPDGECPSGDVETQISSYQDELNRQNHYEYIGALLDRATLPEENGYDYDYDSRGNLTKITQIAKPGNSDRVIFEASYPVTCSNPKTCNKPDWVSDAKGNRTYYTYYSTHGGVDTVTKPAMRNGVQPTAKYTYTSLDTGDGIIWRQTGSSQCTTATTCPGSKDELVTVTTYWGNTLLPKTVTEKAGDNSVSATTTYTYNNAGLANTVTNPMGQVTYYFYDSVGRKIGEIGPDPDGTGPLLRLATRTELNNDDQPILVETGTVTGTTKSHLDSMAVTRGVDTDYDDVGRKAQEKTIAGGELVALSHYSYDDWNRPVCTAQRMNLSVNWSANADACELGAEGAFGPDRITKNEYDDAGQLKKVYRAYGTPLQQVYAAYDYSDNGKKTEVIDANNNKARLEYDEYDRQTHWYFPSKVKGSLSYSSTDFEEYGYDANDNRISHRHRNGSIFIFDFDNLNQIVKKTVPERGDLSVAHTRDVYYGYDTRGQTLYSRFDSHQGEGLTNDYDALGRLENTITSMDGASRKLIYAFNANGVRTAVTHPDGQTFTYTPDFLDRLTGITHSSAGSLASYTYDPKGQLDILGGGITTNYDFNEAGQITSLTHDLAGSAHDNTFGYPVYNPASQIMQMNISNGLYAPVLFERNETYVANGLNQYTSIGGISHSYDDNGNLIADGDNVYAYDQENRLVRASSNGALKAELWYDPLGRLYKVQGATTTTFLYDGDELVAEYNGTSTTVANRYVHGLSVDDPIAWFEGASVTTTNKRHLRANHQASIVAVADSGGNMKTLQQYDTWGRPQSTQTLRFGYTGQVWIPELELWHYKARMYSPELGRFLQTDPVGYEDQMNLYAYVRNDPMNFIDPTGENGVDTLPDNPNDAKDYLKDKVKDKINEKIEDSLTPQQRQTNCIIKKCKGQNSFTMSTCVLKSGCLEGHKEDLEDALERAKEELRENNEVPIDDPSGGDTSEDWSQKKKDDFERWRNEQPYTEEW